MLPATRVLAVVVVPFLVAAFVICYLLPTRTAELFAWGSKPPVTAMLLASVYLGGAAFFVRVALANARRARGAAVAAGPTLPAAVRAVLAVAGVGALVAAAVLFLAPQRLAQPWPWPVTALTARTLAAVLRRGDFDTGASVGYAFAATASALLAVVIAGMVVTARRAAAARPVPVSTAG